MIFNMKEQQRQELFKIIWRIAEEQRNTVDGWDFKQYILGTLFYRFISENLIHFINVGERKVNKGFDYQNLSDEEAKRDKDEIIKEKGFFIYPSQLFSNVVKNLDKKEYKEHLNETLFTIFKEIELSAFGTDSETKLKGLFDDFDVASKKLGNTVDERNDRLVALLKAIADLDIGHYQDNTIDLFGDAYEYLMGMFASKAGKSGGEYFTPQEVSELLAKICVVNKTSVNKVYDPACGSGSLLLKFAKILGKENVHQGFFGQEVNITTYNLCRINMFLHDINYNEFDIALGDTIINPAHWDDEPFEAIVSNPPYSHKWVGDSNPLLINDERFAPAGVLAPKSKEDLAFVMHCLSWLASNGTAAIVCFPGVLHRGGAELKIRKYLIDNNFIDCIIQLPQDLFLGTTIATRIMVLKKNKRTNDVLFIDASNEFVRLDASNKLSQSNIEHILNMFKERKDIEYVCKSVNNLDIEKSGYNLSVSKYVIKEDTRKPIDINEINKQLKEIVVKEDSLRKQIDEIVMGLGNDKN